MSSIDYIWIFTITKKRGLQMDQIINLQKLDTVKAQFSNW